MYLCYNSKLGAYLSKWHNFTKDNLELEWPFRGTLTWAELIQLRGPIWAKMKPNPKDPMVSIFLLVWGSLIPKRIKISKYLPLKGGRGIHRSLKKQQKTFLLWEHAYIQKGCKSSINELHLYIVQPDSPVNIWLTIHLCAYTHVCAGMCVQIYFVLVGGTTWN